MRASSPLELILFALAPALLWSPASEAQCDRIPYCELVWADEFDGAEVDSSKWELQVGDGTSEGLPAGWGNNELQWYQPENAAVADGLLTITARREMVSGYDYTSARLRTRGKGDFTYGRVEMRARMPIGQGLWAAFWMLPTRERYGGWAASGEIDVVEHLGHEPDRIHGTIHFGSPWPGNTSSTADWRLGGGTFHDRFHLFAVEWEPGEIRWYVDGVHYSTKTEWNSSGGPFPAPFDTDFHVLLNLAVGGNFPGPPDATTTFPQELVVDYVRVYQSTGKRGTQAATASLLFDRPAKMKKIDAALSAVFANQSLRRDRPGDGRRLDCAVRARGPKGPLTAAGKLRLELVGAAGGSLWRSEAITAKLDEDGSARFAADEIEGLVEAAAGAGAEIERLAFLFEGSGKKKVTGLDLDCWQRPAD